MLKLPHYLPFHIIGGSRGRARRAPPYGSRFFRFDMQNFRNVAASGVHGPPYEVHAPLREILDPPLHMSTILIHFDTFYPDNHNASYIYVQGHQGPIFKPWSTLKFIFEKLQQLVEKGKKPSQFARPT